MGAYGERWRVVPKCMRCKEMERYTNAEEEGWGGGTFVVEIAAGYIDAAYKEFALDPPRHGLAIVIQDTRPHIVHQVATRCKPELFLLVRGQGPEGGG